MIFPKTREIEEPCRETVRNDKNRETHGRTVRVGRSVALRINSAVFLLNNR